MLQKTYQKQQQVELVILEQMIPQEHLLRRIDRSIDFSFIHKLCEPLYSADHGRPAIDPEVLFRMLFVGYLYGIRSERRLEEEINYNIAYHRRCGEAFRPLAQVHGRGCRISYSADLSPDRQPRDSTRCRVSPLYAQR